MEQPEPNAVARMLGLLGDEWTLLVVQQALLGATRFAEFKTRLPISNSVLTRRLQSLTRDGLLDRRVYQTNPTRSEYVVTPRSRSLWPVLLSIWEWERHWVSDHAERLPGMRHEACGADFAPLLICRSCGEAASDKDVAAQWGPSGSWPRSIPVASTRRRSEADQRRRDGRPALLKPTMSSSVSPPTCGNLPKSLSGGVARRAADVLRRRILRRVAQRRKCGRWCLRR